LQEIVGRIRKKGVRRQRINWIKFLIWVPWFITVLYLILATGGIKQVDFFYMTHNGISVTNMQSFAIFLIVVFLFALLALTIGRRAACHTICWMAPFMILGRKVCNIFSWPALQLTADSEACIQCGQCSNTCPMSIEVMALVQTRRLENDDCILCASCADVCPRRVIHVSLGRGVSS
jgi:polyferredoxin